MGYTENVINIKQRGRGLIILRKYMRKYGRIRASFTDDLSRRLVALEVTRSLCILCCHPHTCISRRPSLPYPHLDTKTGFHTEGGGGGDPATVPQRNLKSYNIIYL